MAFFVLGSLGFVLFLQRAGTIHNDRGTLLRILVIGQYRNKSSSISISLTACLRKAVKFK